MINEYEKQADVFLEMTNTTINTEFLKYDYHFEKDTDKRDIYKVNIKRGSRQFTFNFGQSLVNSQVTILHHKFDVPDDIRIKYIKAVENIIRLNNPNGNWINGELNKEYAQAQNTKKFAYHQILQIINKKLGRMTDKERSSFKIINKPTNYDILACLTAYDPYKLKDFCSEFGYDEDSKTAEKIYNAVVNEWQNVCMLWTDDEIEQLQEIT